MSRIYRALLLAYPQPFRHRFGQAMVDDFEQELREAHGRSRARSLPALWWRALSDSLVTSLHMRWAAWRGRPGAPLSRRETSSWRWLGHAGGSAQGQPGGGDGRRESKEMLGRARWHTPLDALRIDVRFALRALRRRPGFTAAAVLTLALGIGANAAMFGVIKTVVLAPLPFVAPERVVQLWDLPPEYRGTEIVMSKVNFRDYENLNEVFSHFAAVRQTDDLYRERENRFEQMEGAYLSADLFDMMGVVPTRGRTFRAEEDIEGVGNIVLLTHAYWLREFGGEEVVGQTIPLRRGGTGNFRAGIPNPNYRELEYEIIGVLPPDFRLPPLLLRDVYAVWTEPEVVLPMGLWTYGWDRRHHGSLRTLAQLREGVTVEQARANLQDIAAGISEIAPETEKGLEVTVVSVGELLRKEYGMALGFLWAATALVLLVACASVSSLLLGWGVAREQELAVRAALGAGARRIFSQLITEGMVLAAAAGALGVSLAYWGIAALKMLAPAGVHRLDEVSLDVGVLGFTLGVSLVTVLLVGLWPALRGARGRSSEVLKAGGRGATLARTRSLRVLVTAEVALSLVLLAGAGLMLQSFWNLVGVDTGIGGEQVLHVTIQTLPGPLTKYPGQRGSLQQLTLMRDRVEAIPGVTSFAISRQATLSGSEAWANPVTIPGRGADERLHPGYRNVSFGYFRTLGIRLLEGRTWESQSPSWLWEVVISEAMAKAAWPGESAVGKVFYDGDHDPDVVSQSLDAWRPFAELVDTGALVPGGERFRDQRPDGPRPFEVIGVVVDVRNTLEREAMPTVYWHNSGGSDLFVRTSVDPAGLAQVLRHEIEAADPETKVLQIRTMEQIVAELGADSRFRALLVILFAVLATGITCLGLFGVLTYAVAQRKRELGIRMALGAGNSHIAGLVLSQGARMVGLGVALGFVLVYSMTRYISSLLFGIVPLDSMTLGGVAALVFALALLAAYLPARRAMRTDPIEALQQV